MTDGEGWAEVAGGRLPYEVAGSGSGVVLAHAGIADMRQWDPQWAALTARHRVVRYDLRGFGRADVVETRFSNRADLVAVMDAAGLDRAVLVGCSRAGSIAIDTALGISRSRVGSRLGLRRPERLRGRGDARGACRRRARGGALRGQGLGGDGGVRRGDVGRRARPARGTGAGSGARGGAPDDVRDLRAGEAVRRHDRARPAGDRAPGRGARADPRDDRRPRHAVDAGLGGRRRRPGSPARAGSTCRTSPTCRASSARTGSTRRCWSSSPASRSRAAIEQSDDSARCDGAPRDDPLDRDPDQRPAVDARGSRTAGTSREGRRRLRRVQALARLEEVGAAVEPDPAELRPVLVPRVDQQRDRRSRRGCPGRARAGMDRRTAWACRRGR